MDADHEDRGYERQFPDEQPVHPHQLYRDQPGNPGGSISPEPVIHIQPQHKLLTI